jgi:SAM-dependent methyltransferase
MQLKEEEIRPAILFDSYLALAAEDAKWLAATAEWEHVDCWACGEVLTKAFKKLDFSFGECEKCRSIVANPRPIQSDIARFYSEGKSPKFWATDFYRETAESRRELLWRPKAQDVFMQIQSLPDKPFWICDIGAGYGIFLEEMRKLLPDTQFVAIEPTPSLAVELKKKSFNVIEKFLADVERNDLPEGPGFFTSFELLEHLHNPLSFLRDVKNLCADGGVFLATTLSAWGLDIQLLREKSKAIFPPHHLQILTPKAIKGLSAKVGFKDVKVTTPGKLDLDIAYKFRAEITEGFWKIFLSESNVKDRERLQDLIASAGFSSHMWCLFEK